MGDYHARFCERFKVKLLLSTRLRGRKTKVGEKLLRFPPTRFVLEMFLFALHFYNTSIYNVIVEFFLL